MMFCKMEETVFQIKCAVRQIILWATEQPIHNPHYILPTLTAAIVEIEDPILETYAKKLPLLLIPEAISTVFKDKTINYGRLVSIFAFCAKMAHLNKDNPEYLAELENQFAKIIYNETGAWFASHGGWGGFQKFMRKTELNIKWIHFGVIALIMIFLIYRNIL